MQVRVFRRSQCLMTRFFSFLKYGGESAARLIAEAELVAMEREATKLYGPPIITPTNRGRHHAQPSCLNHSLLPGIALRYRYRKNSGHWGIHVTWQEGIGPDRRQHHREFGIATHGPFKALSTALNVRADKTDLPQVAPDIAWLRLCNALRPDAGRPLPPAWDGPRN